MSTAQDVERRPLRTVLLAVAVGAAGATFALTVGLVIVYGVVSCRAPSNPWLCSASSDDLVIRASVPAVVVLAIGLVGVVRLRWSWTLASASVPAGVLVAAALLAFGP